MLYYLLGAYLDHNTLIKTMTIEDVDRCVEYWYRCAQVDRREARREFGWLAEELEKLKSSKFPKLFEEGWMRGFELLRREDDVRRAKETVRRKSDEQSLWEKMRHGQNGRNIYDSRDEDRLGD